MTRFYRAIPESGVTPGDKLIAATGMVEVSVVELDGTHVKTKVVRADPGSGFAGLEGAIYHMHLQSLPQWRLRH